MPLIMVAKTQSEKDCKAQVVKFLDRLNIKRDGSAEGILEFVILVQEESGSNLSKCELLLPNKIESNETRDVTDSLNDLKLFINRGYSIPVSRMSNEAGKKRYNVDGVVVSTSDEKLSFSKPSDNDHDFCLFSVDFAPIEPGESRIFRIAYKVVNFASIFPSSGYARYIFNNPIYSLKHYNKIDNYKSLAMDINRKLCEIAIYLPKDYIYDFASPIPHKTMMTHLHELFSEFKATEMKSALYYDLEAVEPLPGEVVGDWISPDVNQSTNLYFQFRKPAPASDDFEEKIATLNGQLEKSYAKLNSEIHGTEQKLKGLHENAENRLDRLLQNSKTTFIITLIVSGLAILLSIIQLINSFG